MAIASIQDWLRTKGSYTHGIELLKLHGQPSPSELFLFSRPETSYSRQRLERALLSLRDKAIVEVEPPRKTVEHVEQELPSYEGVALQASLRQEPPRDVPEESLPASLQPLRRELKQLHQEMLMLRGMMIKTPDGHELRDQADKVVALHERIRSGWRRIEYYRATGNVLDMSKPKVNTVELMRELRALNVWISQRNSGARKGTPEQIAAKRARKLQVETLLKDAAEQS